MGWYLLHHFNPYLDHLRLKPAHAATADTDLYNLGYVQNVITGQVLARMVPLDTVRHPDRRFILHTHELPTGINTHVDPQHPTYLLASCNGYVFYNEGLIAVKKILNVRGDVSFHTGNIFFVGDLAVHGSVRAGFEVQANNVWVADMVEGGSVRARRNLIVTGGARGGAGKHCVLDAGGNLRASFIEKLETRARGNIQIEKYCMYSNIYGGANVVVQDRVYGGVVQVYKSMLVQGHVGNMAGVSTRIFLGYDPERMRQLERCDTHINEITQKVVHLAAVAGHLPPETNTMTRKLALLQSNRTALAERRALLWNALEQDEQTAQPCRLVVRGTVFPGVEVAIGKAIMTVEKPLHNVVFRQVDNEIHIQDAPPLAAHSA